MAAEAYILLLFCLFSRCSMERGECCNGHRVLFLLAGTAHGVGGGLKGNKAKQPRRLATIQVRPSAAGWMDEGIRKWTWLAVIHPSARLGRAHILSDSSVFADLRRGGGASGHDHSVRCHRHRNPDLPCDTGRWPTIMARAMIQLPVTVRPGASSTSNDPNKRCS